MAYGIRGIYAWNRKWRYRDYWACAYLDVENTEVAWNHLPWSNLWPIQRAWGAFRPDRSRDKSRSTGTYTDNTCCVLVRLESPSKDVSTSKRTMKVIENAVTIKQSSKCTWSYTHLTLSEDKAANISVAPIHVLVPQSLPPSCSRPWGS